MRWPSISALLVFTTMSFFVMLHVKTEVQVLGHEKTKLLREQKQYKETYKVLQAEFAHLSRPERLRAFVQEMGYQEVDTEQVVPVSLNSFWGE